MKATVDDERCRGHGICWSLCPEVFALNGDGYAEVQRSEVPTGLEEAVEAAAGSCPEGAITAS